MQVIETGDRLKHTVTVSKITRFSGFECFGIMWDYVSTQFDNIAIFNKGF